MMRQFAVTIDVEPDLPRYVSNGFHGISEGLPRLLGLLAELSVRTDCFITSSLLPRFSSELKAIVLDGHSIGLHGLTHDLLAGRSFRFQRERILKGLKQLEEHLGTHATMFRAPNFGADEGTFRALRAAGIKIDSSVLPGRVVKRWRVLTVADHRGTPIQPYEIGSAGSTGSGPLLEVPVTANPLAPGTPIGMGFLNRVGPEAALRAAELTQANLVTFLVHPWECIDLTEVYPTVPQSWSSACRSDLSGLSHLLMAVRRSFSLTTICDFGSAIRSTSKSGGGA